MSTNKTIIVIIGGGWHTAESYAKLTRALEAAGHEVHCPQYPSMNQERPPTASLAEDSTFIRTYVENLVDFGHQVVPLMHCYGSQIGSNCLYGLGLQNRSGKGLSGVITEMIYLAGYVLPEDLRMIDKVNEMRDEGLMPVTFDFAADLMVFLRYPKEQLVGSGGEVSDNEASDFMATLKLWNGRCIYDATSHAAWREIPVTYVYTMEDLFVPLNYQQSMVKVVEAQGIKVKTHELATGHCPGLTAADEIVEIVNKVVG
ncbi:putative hydrolase R7-like protein [Cladobotryum mycophilum]|uniref:Hydrolase R7-like protein n=1 Tax=Cladobotryum mycophilum TaxID=491253 RepID=A0ABR0SVZ2_9HYPO